MSQHPFELRYNDEGKVLAKLYPHQSGRVAYVYDQSGKLDTVLAGKLYIIIIFTVLILDDI